MSILLLISLADVLLISATYGYDHILHNKGINSSIADKMKVVLALITVMLIIIFAGMVTKNNELM